MMAVCDLWNVHRERAIKENARYYGRSPRAYQYLEDVLALADVDAVVISTPNIRTSPILKMAAEAGKDAYVEKPMVMFSLKPRRHAIPSSNATGSSRWVHSIVATLPTAAHDLVQSGVLGDHKQSGDRVELSRAQVAGRRKPRRVRNKTPDWRKWLMTKPYRPFDPPDLL